jgi:hypothetical protein
VALAVAAVEEGVGGDPGPGFADEGCVDEVCGSSGGIRGRISPRSSSISSGDIGLEQRRSGGPARWKGKKSERWLGQQLRKERRGPSN